MAQGTLPSLGQFQWGAEAANAPGTPVAATSILAVEQLSFKPTDETSRPKLAQGIAIANPGHEYVPMRGMDLDLPSQPAYFEQLQNWLNMAVVEDAAPTGAAAPYTWTFTRNPLVVPTVRSFTIERRLSDGIAANFQDERWSYCLLSSLKLEATLNGDVMIGATGFGRARDASALTPTQALPADLQQLLGSQSAVSLDDTWAALGTTAINAKVLGWSFEFTTGLMNYYAATARASKDFSGHWLNPEEVDIKVSLTMIVDSDRVDELAHAAASDLRAMRIDVGGTGDRRLRLDMLLKHEMGSLYEIGSQDGQDIIEMPFMGATDGTNFFSAEVMNGIATLA